MELASLGDFAVWVSGLTSGILRFLAALAGVVFLGTVWATFAVPDDPSRPGNAPVPVPGALRLVLELVILFGGALAFYLAGSSATGIVLAALIVLHYALSIDRNSWLRQQ